MKKQHLLHITHSNSQKCNLSLPDILTQMQLPKRHKHHQTNVQGLFSKGDYGDMCNLSAEP